MSYSNEVDSVSAVMFTDAVQNALLNTKHSLPDMRGKLAWTAAIGQLWGMQMLPQNKLNNVV